MSRYDFFWNDVSMPDTLPKDEMIELQMIQTEMSMKLESRRGAMERIGRDNIDFLISEIEKEEQENSDKELEKLVKQTAVMGQFEPKPEQEEEEPKLNSGMMNSETPIEQVRKEILGKNE